MGIGKCFCEVASAGRLYHTDTDSAYDADAKDEEGGEGGRLDISYFEKKKKKKLSNKEKRGGYRAHKIPSANKNDRPIFLRSGSCSVHTMGSGSKRMMISVPKWAMATAIQKSSLE